MIWRSTLWTATTRAGERGRVMHAFRRQASAMSVCGLRRRDDTRNGMGIMCRHCERLLDASSGATASRSGSRKSQSVLIHGNDAIA